MRLLRGGEGDPPGAAPFALCGRPGWRTRVYAAASRDATVKQMVANASKRLGISIAGEARSETGPAAGADDGRCSPLATNDRKKTPFRNLIVSPCYGIGFNIGCMIALVKLQYAVSNFPSAVLTQSDCKGYRSSSIPPADCMLHCECSNSFMS